MALSWLYPVYAKDFFADRSGPVDGVVTHELAHQWVGDSLALAAWSDIWLNEGFATYSEWLWNEHEDRDTVQENYDAIASIPADDPFWRVKIGDPGVDALFDGAVYYRGAATLHALRLKVGDEAFFGILRRWTRSRAGGNVTIPEFITLAERLSGQDLDAFFDEWLFTAAKPASLDAAGAGARTQQRELRRARTLHVLKR